MTALDWVLLAIVAVSALLGVMRGFIGVLASLAAWVLAGWAAFRFGGQAAMMVSGGVAPSTGQLLAGYALSFLAVMVLVGLVGWMVRRLVHSVGLSGLDRMLGLGIGVARGAFVACALVLMLGLTTMPREPEWQRSQMVPVFVPGAQWMRAWLPDWVAEQVDLRRGGAMPLDGTLPYPALPTPVTGDGRS
ncbi:CvpA family protein [Lysobacter sp. A3-1-A15]|uniref:CvpA family protein n=1 Tax=Novilysobacter viscosus TaxID=3098602 RepID=UPI002EDB0928